MSASSTELTPSPSSGPPTPSTVLEQRPGLVPLLRWWLGWTPAQITCSGAAARAAQRGRKGGDRTSAEGAWPLP